MKSSSVSETSRSVYQTTRCHVRQERFIHRHRCENLSGDINYSSHLMVPRIVRAEFVVKTGIRCQIFLCVLQVCSIHIYSSLTGAIAASLNSTRNERRELTNVSIALLLCWKMLFMLSMCLRCTLTIPNFKISFWMALVMSMSTLINILSNWN